MDEGDDILSGEDCKPVLADADTDTSPRGQDHVRPSSSKCDSSSHPLNATKGESFISVESNKTPIEGEPDHDCNGPSGQDEKDLPTDTKSRVAESESDSVVGSTDDPATSSNATKTNVTSTESIVVSSQPSEGASEADAPCVDTPLGSASDSCSINTPAKCHI